MKILLAFGTMIFLFSQLNAESHSSQSESRFYGVQIERSSLHIEIWGQKIILPFRESKMGISHLLAVKIRERGTQKWLNLSTFILDESKKLTVGSAIIKPRLQFTFDGMLLKKKTHFKRNQRQFFLPKKIYCSSKTNKLEDFCGELSVGKTYEFKTVTPEETEEVIVASILE